MINLSFIEGPGEADADPRVDGLRVQGVAAMLGECPGRGQAPGTQPQAGKGGAEYGRRNCHQFGRKLKFISAQFYF